MRSILRRFVVAVLRALGYELRRRPAGRPVVPGRDPRFERLGFSEMVDALKRLNGNSREISAFAGHYRLEKDDRGISFRFQRTGSNLDAVKDLVRRNRLEIYAREDGGVVPVRGELAHEKVHYGCGDKLFEGWLNVDRGSQEIPDYLGMNLADRHPFKDDSFRFAFSEDVLEHLDQDDSFIFLSEAFRTLRPNGVFRLSFPGLEGVLRMHYSPWTSTTAFSGKLDAYLTWEHRHFYSFEEIKLVASAIGFRKVTRVEYGLSEHDELKGLDTRIAQADLNCRVELLK